MSSSAVALAWQLWGRHRRGMLAVLGVVLALAVLAQVLPVEHSSPPRMSLLATIALVLLPVVMGYLLAVFAFGFGGMAVEATASGYPSWLFTRPVRTVALVGWPMLYGAATVTLTWVLLVCLVLQPGGLQLPLVRPSLVLVVVLFWVQAITWSSFPIFAGRLVMLFAGLVVLILGIAAAQFFQVSPALQTMALGACLPPTCILAYRGVDCARRGAAAEWRLWPAAGTTARPVEPSRGFATAFAAQVWYEWRLHGLSFPLLLGLLLVADTGMIWFEVRYEAVIGGELVPPLAPLTHETRVAFFVLQPLLMLPPVLAAIFCVGLGRMGPRFDLSPFLATRPLATSDLVRAKWRMTAWSTLACWAVTILMAGVWLAVTGTSAEVAGWWQQVAEEHQPLRTALLFALTGAGLVGLTWLQMNKGLWLGLTGKLLRTPVVFVYIGVLVAVPVLAKWTWQHPEWHEVLRVGAEWALGVAVLGKVVGSAGIMRVVLRRRLLKMGTVLRLLGVWCVTALCLLLPLAEFGPADRATFAMLAGVVVLLLPLGQILLAPLALERNRHR
jgi:hypothetical protein